MLGNQEETINKKDMTVVIYKHSSIKSFIDNSTIKYSDTEYQCHYYAIVQTIELPQGNLNLVYPILYYNYPQKVSSARVDVEWKDISDTAKSLSNLVQQLFKLNVVALDSHHKTTPYKDMKVSYQLTTYNNIHRHP